MCTLSLSFCHVYADDQLETAADPLTVITEYDDVYSLHALKKIQLSQLKIDAKASQPESVKDPLQPLNRKVYAFNMILDNNVIRPIAVQYEEKIPEDVRGSYGNFRSNLREPWNAVNQILQGKPKVAAKSLGRFTINTLTSLGFADTAKRKDLSGQKEDFGTTLGVWGVKSGPYIMLPLLGPSTFRDGAGTIVDGFARPQRYIFENDKIYWTNTFGEGIDTRAQFLSLDSILQGDQYSALRDAYLQQRSFTIANKRGDDLATVMFAEESPFTEEFDDEELPDETQPDGE